MRVIVLAATKGGVGKTTLASALAVAAAGEKKMVGMLDLDPQQSLAMWWARRGSVDNPKVYAGVDTVSEAVEILEGHGVDYLFIDTGPGILRNLEPSIKAADLVVIPVKASAFDLQAIDPVLEVAGESSKAYLMVLNECDTRSKKMTESAAEFLESGGHKVATQRIMQRTAYRAAATAGKSGPEVERDSQCSDEISALWKQVKVMLKGDKRRG